MQYVALPGEKKEVKYSQEGFVPFDCRKLNQDSKRILTPT
jgi:hypothetical protein